MKTTPLVPMVPAGAASGMGWPRRGVAFAIGLHVLLLALLLLAGRLSPRVPEGAELSYELVFDDGQGSKAALPPAQPAEVPAPDETLVGPPAPTPETMPSPDAAGRGTPVPAEVPLPPPPEAPPTAAPATPAPSTSPMPAPPVTVQQAPAEVNLQPPPEPTAPEEPADIMPMPPPPLPPPPQPRPVPPRPVTPRAPPGTLGNPMSFNLGPSPARPPPAARGSVASRAIDLSLPPGRPGSSRSDAYADIRAAKASATWNAGLKGYWDRHKFYPAQAQEGGESGTVTVQLTVDRSGRVEDVQILSRSGSPWLDMAAVSTWRNAKLAPFTDEMREDRLIFPLDLHYIIVR